MKKEFLAMSLLLGGLILATPEVFAMPEYSCVAPYDMSSKVSTVLTRVTGVNLLSEKVAEQVLKAQITKNAKGNFKVGVNSYSANDLTNGRFKGLSVHGENVVADGVYFSVIDVKTLCDFNYIVYDKKASNAIFKEDLPLSFGITLSEADLNNTMSASGYGKLIDKVNAFGKKLSLFDIESTKVYIKENRFYYVFNLNVPLLGFGKAKPLNFTLISDVSVENGKIVLKNSKLVNNFMDIDLSVMAGTLNYLNPLEYSLKVFKEKNAVLKVRNVVIINDKINVSGIFNVPKDVLTQK